MAAADTPNLPHEAEGAQPGRRTVLRGISALGLAAFAVPLAARASDGNNATTALPEASLESNAGAVSRAKAGPKPTPTPKPAPKAKKKPKAAPKGKPKAAPKGAKLVKASDTPLASGDTIPVNSGYLFEADEYIVTQPTAGKFVGFDSLCTHEGCPVDVFDTPGVMSCSCHSTNFKITDGKVISGPAKKPMPKRPIIVENGQIYRAKPAK
ncbi:Rieske (2Fe-2S) protein [Sporichthya sp.]|uniref:Rieske (2Fe-2S) protein n=1 Tax=Sporichthya sp. TaxID=65475 RepID=UPI0017DDA5B6|nr:Rieske (2Fe-2S) protein [Sporichthya sp.]MBA3745301.1 Rieske (2Fe-2S) protein [Sporichthya sp.]